MSVAIVIPTWNAAATLTETIVSALGQNFLAAEIVVADDGSEDGSAAIAAGFAPRVRLVAGPHRGVSAARNRGIAAVSGDWIVFLDADDLLLPGTLLRRLRTAEAAAADIVVCDWAEFGDGPVTVRSAERELAAADDLEAACAASLWAPPAALMYRRSLVEKIGGFRADLPVIQDARFLFDAVRHGGRLVRSAHVGARYRITPRSLSRRDSTGFWRDVLHNGRQIEALWRAQGVLSPARCAALAGIYDNAARGLLRAAHPAYFDAAERQRRIGGPMPLHPRLAVPLARTVGLHATRRLFRFVGR
ncbi:MAG TPA: glycosyltransferase [Stellaceae bacterium]|nr:glycosyltransferase [Stellaceae bacterium]